MKLRKATAADIDTLLEIFANGRKIQKSTGNMNQWAETYPSRQLIEEDIKAGRSYVCVIDEERDSIPAGTIVATIVIQEEPEPTYDYIEDGNWLNNNPYVTIHRIATSGKVKGAGQFCMQQVVENYSNIRIDTHRDNKPMISLINKFGFTYCGIIYTHDGSPRFAYQLTH